MNWHVRLQTQSCEVLLEMSRCLRWISKTQKELGSWWGSVPGEQELGKNLNKLSSLTGKLLEAHVEVVPAQRSYREEIS